METCECGSLIIKGICSNTRCGTGNHVRWAERDDLFYSDMKSDRLVTAHRGPSLAREVYGIKLVAFTNL